MDLPFLACALAALAWLPTQRALNPLVCVLLVAGYAVAANVRISLGSKGYAPAVQLIYVPMLFLAPLNLVPLLVLAGLVAGDLVASRPLRRSVLRLGDGWYSLGPVLVLAAAGHDAFAWTYWPVYVLALAAQSAVDALAGTMRVRMYDGERPRLRQMGVPAGIDLVLSVPALGIVAVAAEAPVAAALTCVSLLTIARGFSTERRGRLAERDHATHDPLTGLPNRLLFDELARAASERARRDGAACAVMVVDLDAFKAVNDELGHEAGDRILVQAAARLRDVVRASDSVARRGGDEFAVLLSGRQTVETCELVGCKVREAFEAPFDLPTRPRRVGASIGAALVAGDGTFAQALHNADLAMYADKQRRRSAATP